MTNFEVFNYWKERQLPDGQPILIDSGEPSCWACGKPFETETKQLLEKGDFKKVWNKTQGKLEKCHIIPRALGGSDEPENIFLLCGSCHIESPDTIYPDIFFKWIEFKRKRCIFGLDLVALRRQFDDILDLYRIHDKNNFFDYMSNDVLGLSGKDNVTHFEFMEAIRASNQYGFDGEISSHYGQGISRYSSLMLIVREYCVSCGLIEVET